MWLLYLLFPLIGAQACVPSKSSLPGVGGGHYRIDGYVHSMLLRSAAALELKTGSRAGERDRPSLFPSGVVPTCSPASNRQQLSTCRSHSVRRIGSEMIRIRGPHAPRVPLLPTPLTHKKHPLLLLAHLPNLQWIHTVHLVWPTSMSGAYRPQSIRGWILSRSDSYYKETM